MIIVDTNILIYAYHPQLPQHERVAEWLETSLSEGRNSIGLIWQVICSFLRISTNPRIFGEPMSIMAAKGHIDNLLAHPMVQQINTTDRHWKIYAGILYELNLVGDVVIDAHIAASAIEHNARVASVDKDFRRFSDHVKIVDPLAK